MVFIEGGTFQMGDVYGYENEKPVHAVTLSDFYLGKTEVTQAQWRAVMGTDPSYFKNCDQCPVEKISWHDAQEFVKKLNAKTGKTYRLPTEAEWEYAARGGKNQNHTYAGSNTVEEVAWYIENSGDKTHPVGQKKANELGLHDMSGNVYEWCQDWYDVNYYAKCPSDSPKGPNTGFGRVGRGGSWGTIAIFTRVAFRNLDDPFIRGNYMGFRIAKQK
jgi:formylglycine-generating enzyme required for sulfatase activity